MPANFTIMRLIHTITLLLLSTFVLSSCDNTPNVIYAIGIDKEIVCTHEEQEITIEYNIHQDVRNSDTKISATCNASWVKSIDTSEIGKVVVRLEENSGDKRTAKITLSSPICVTTSVELMQYDTPPTVANHTLMYCFLGTSLSSYFRTNLEDAAAAINTGILSNNNRVIFFRQESKYSGYIGEIYYDGKERRLKEITLSSSIIKPEKVADIIATMAELAPAERYGIVFAGHGQGWITREILAGNNNISTLSLMANPWVQAAGAEVTRAFGENNVQLDIEELAEGIEQSNVELDYILFDACFMSNIETIYDLRHSANYIIASPCEIMGRGFPYHRTLPYLFQDNGKTTDYIGAAKSYHDFYKSEYTGSGRCGSITVYDCSKVDALAEATSLVMESAITQKDPEYKISHIQTYEGQEFHHFFDFGQWMNYIARDDEALATFNSRFDDCVIATYTLDTFYSAYGSYGSHTIDLDVYSGVTTSAPSVAYPNGWRETNWYKEVIALEN